jgi:S1-C subfamily serine protease
VVASALALLLVVAGIAATRRSATVTALNGAQKEQVDKTVKAAVDQAAKDAASAPARSVQVYQAILPSVVIVQTKGSDPSSDEEGLGSGVIVNAQGAILTARHVVAGASTITVTYVDGTTANAVVAFEQPDHDIAVLTPDAPPQVLVPAVLASSRGLRVGDEAYAVGHPLQLVDSMSAGVISGLDRTIPVPGGGKLTGLIQFDTAVNPGNSGGPLLNRDGQVIGIVTALANPSQQGFFVGIGFAVPIETAGGGAGAPSQ